jgi:hypothetical protein
MSEVRRGPEYIPARQIMAKRSRIRRGLSLALIPVVGAGLALFVTSIILPQRHTEDQFERLEAALRNLGDFHAIEYRPMKDREIILREEWTGSNRRRVEYFGGQMVLYHFSTDGRSRDLIYEPGPGVARRHRGASMGASAPARLLSDLTDREVRTESGPDDMLVVVSRGRRHLIRMDARSGRPTQWTTYFPSDIGDQVLSRTEVEYGAPDSAKLQVEPEVQSLLRTSPGRPPGRNRRATEPVAVIGQGAEVFDLDWIHINQYGDLFYAFQSATERPFVHVVDSLGNLYSPLDIIIGDRTTDRFAGEQLALRLDNTHIAWPLTITLSVQNSDPRFLAGQDRKRKIGSYTMVFDKPTCFLAPPQWFSPNVSDSPIYDYLRTRHYRLALVFQHMLRTPEGRMVDTLAGGAASLEMSENLKKDPNDLRRAIAEARTFLRMRNEFDSGRMSAGRIYVLLAELHHALGEREAAQQAIEFAQGMVREGRVDLNTVGDIERTAKELGL